MRPELLGENTYLLRSASVWITMGCGLAAPIARGRNAETAVAATTDRYRSAVNKWKVAGLVALGFVVGGVIGGLIGFAWHAPGGPKTWNDVRSWATFVVLVLGFSVAAFELNLQRVQFARQAARQEVTDDLLERQRREIMQTELARQREQAEHIALTWVKPMGSTGTDAKVCNDSRRPITTITARVVVRLPDGGLSTHSAAGWTLIGDQSRFPPELDYLPVITPGAAAEFHLPHGGDGAAPRLVARFDDDAGRRWQLDNYMHLEPAPDNDW